MNPNGALLYKTKCLLLMVDIQEVILDLCVEKEALRQNAAALIDMAGILNMPIIFTEQYPQRLGPFVPDLIQRASNAPVLPKITFGCFDNADIADAITAQNPQNILLAGIVTHICIMHTALQALERGYGVHVISDGVSAPNPHDHDKGLKRLSLAGAVISSTEMALYELLNRADTPEFKTALPLLKKLEQNRHS